MGHIQTFDDVLGMIKRRWLLILLVGGAGILLSVFVGSTQPAIYETAAVIQIETPVVAESAGAPVVSNTGQVLQLIEQRQLTRESLLAMIDRHGLYAEAQGMTSDQKVTALRQSVQFQSIASAAPQGFGTPPGVSALIITTRFLDGPQGARVANDFAQSILDQSTEGQAARSRETMRFFVEEESRVGQEIVTLEADIATYKNGNADALPAARDTRQDEITALDANIRTLDQSLVGLEGERSVLENAANLRAVEQRQLETLIAQIGVLTAQKTALADRRAEVRSAMSRTPDIERELGAFDRRLQQLQDQYGVITRRLAEADTSQRLEERNQLERFTLLERATVPQQATGGSGKKLMALGVGVSLVVAFGLALLLEMMNPVLRTGNQMLRQLDLIPVILIPDLPLAAAHRRNAPESRNRPSDGVQRMVMIAAAVVLLLVVMTAAAVIPG